MDTSNLFLTFVLSLVMGGLTAYFAKQRGRDPYLWFAIGMLLGLIGFIILFFMSNEKEAPKPVEEVVFAELPLEWYYLDSQAKSVGPVSVEELRAMWEKTLHGESYVWSEGMESWKKILEIPELERSLMEGE